MLKMILLLLIEAGIVKLPPKSITEADYRYGPLTEYQLPNQARTLMKIDLSKFLPGRSDNVYINRDMALPLLFVLIELEEKGLLNEIKYFAGCYNPRPVRGQTKPSAHAYGLACDFPLLNVGQYSYSDRFIETWENFGFCSGHRFGDRMHFSYTQWECSDLWTNNASNKASGKMVPRHDHGAGE